MTGVCTITRGVELRVLPSSSLKSDFNSESYLITNSTTFSVFYEHMTYKITLSVEPSTAGGMDHFNDDSKAHEERGADVQDVFESAMICGVSPECLDDSDSLLDAARCELRAYELHLIVHLLPVL